jgi:hypothetical protein
MSELEPDWKSLFSKRHSLSKDRLKSAELRLGSSIKDLMHRWVIQEKIGAHFISQKLDISYAWVKKLMTLYNLEDHIEKNNKLIKERFNSKL